MPGSCTPTAVPAAVRVWPARRSTITVGEILLAIDGPLAAVRDLPPESSSTRAPRATCPPSGAGCTSCLHDVLDGVTVAELVAGDGAGLNI